MSNPSLPAGATAGQYGAVGALAPPASPPIRSGAVTVAHTVQRAAGWCTLFLIFALSMELTSRIIDWVRFRMPIFSPVTSESDLIVRDRTGMHGRPNVRYRQWGMNSLGLRGREIAAAKPPGTVRIIAVGASETFGLYESPGKDYPEQLEDTLNAMLSRKEHDGQGTGPRAYQVLNAAMPGMSLPTLEQDFRNRLAELHPDLVVLYPTPAGYLNSKAPAATPPDTSPGSHPLRRQQIFYPRVLADLRTEVKQLAPTVLLRWGRQRELRKTLDAHPPDWRFTAVPQDRLSQYDADLRGFVGIIRAAGSEPILGTHANVFMGDSSGDKDVLAAWERFYPRATGAVIVAFDSAARIVTQRVAADSGVVVVDLAAALSGDTRGYFADAIHFTDTGSALVANRLAVAIESRIRPLREKGGG